MPFITFEGLDGSGKTTQIAATVEWLRARGADPLLTREPGGTLVGDAIRALVHDPRHSDLNAAAEFLLYAASRAQLVDQVIRPALARGLLVIADRYTDSTLAYQGYGRGLDLPTLEQITHFATGGLRPDCTVYLDMAPEAALQRRRQAAAEGAEWTRLDAEALAFHERVYSGYQHLIAAEPARFICVSAVGTVETIQMAIRAGLSERLSLPAER